MRFLVFLLVLTAYIACIVWLVRDARRRNANPILIGLVFSWLGPLAVLGWLWLRPPIATVIHTYADYTDPADALETAALLDAQGEWGSAIELYRYVADRWPDQMAYAFACIREIHTKQDLAR